MKVTVFFLEIDADEASSQAFLTFHLRENLAERAELVASLLRQGRYRKMAEVSGTAEDAFVLMQNGVRTDSWTLSPPPGVQVLVEAREHEGKRYGHRSMSVGDIVVDQDGRVLLCATLGFDDITKQAALSMEKPATEAGPAPSTP
jgi:hypothetical protein